MRTAGLILAAGRSSRMGRDKALLEFRGRTFLNHLIYLALPRVDTVVAVLGHNASRIAATLPADPRVRAVINEDYDRGMLSSLQRGLSAVDPATEWILWMLVDHPGVRGRTLDSLLAAAAASDAPVVIPRAGGKRGHPIVLGRETGERLRQLSPEKSPQDVVRATYGEACFVDLSDEGVRGDIDRPSDYRKLVGAGPG